MKILHITDIHCNYKWFDWLYSIRNTYDHICLSGDLVDVVHRDVDDPIKVQIRYVIEFLQKWDGCPLHICSGNHDVWVLMGNKDTFKNELYCSLNNKDIQRFTMDFAMKLADLSLPKNVYYNRNVELDDTWFIGMPWKGSDELRFFAAPSVEDVTKTKIVLHHCPPPRMKTSVTKSSYESYMMFEDTELYKWCNKQENMIWLLSGHIHTPVKNFDMIKNIVSLNPGRNVELSIPHFIVFDTKDLSLPLAIN